MVRVRCVLPAFIIALLAFSQAFAQVAGQGSAQGTAPQQTVTPPKAEPAQPQPLPQVNKPDLVRRINQEIDVDIEGQLSTWQKDLDQIEENLREEDLKPRQLNEIRERLNQMRAKVDEVGAKVPPRLANLRAQAEKLGPRPTQDQPPELEHTAMRRAELAFMIGTLEGAQRQVGNTYVRIDQATNTLQDVRRKRFTRNLFQPTPGIYTKKTWEGISEAAAEATPKVIAKFTDWWDEVKDEEVVRNILYSTAALFLILFALSWRGIGRLRDWQGSDEPPFWRRASSAAVVVLLRTIPVIIPVVYAYNAIHAVHPFEVRTGWLIYSAAKSLFTIVLVNALTITVLAPGKPQWRLIAASDWAARRICFLVFLLSLVYGVGQFLFVANRIVQAPFSLDIATSLPTSLLTAVLAMTILMTRLEAGVTLGGASDHYLKMLRGPVWLVAIAIIVAAVTGYLALARFIALQLVVTGSILAVVYLLLLWVDGLAQTIADEHSQTGRWLQETLALDQRRREQLNVPLSLLLKLSILLGSVPLIMLQWGYPWPDIIAWYRKLLFGLEIGSTHISLAAALASLIVFILGYFAARLFQSWLDSHILKPAGISGGLRDSIRTGVGYVGVTAAALIALSYAGFSLSNLAIVAGAFSVGIGFGLQSIVNNFVSGLILLAERPIKVGDLVVVGGEEGHVRKISVRSTEIETFDRAHVLVPNSYFITEKVKNWTLRNNTGRITIDVAVDFDSDPRAVTDILLGVARRHPNVMTAPEPFVDFEEITADSLRFKLYAFVYDLNKTIGTRNDLRVAILETFKEKGITIPARQTELTMGNTEWLREAIRYYVSAQSEAAGQGPAKPHALHVLEKKVDGDA